MYTVETHFGIKKYGGFAISLCKGLGDANKARVTLWLNERLPVYLKMEVEIDNVKGDYFGVPGIIDSFYIVNVRSIWK